VHIGDRESDIYELFCTAEQSGTKFLLRTCVDRLAGDGQHTISAAMRNAKVKAVYRIQVRDAKGTVSEADGRGPIPTTSDFMPPIGKQKRYPSLTLTVIHAQERTKTERSREDRLEADHKSFCAVAQRRIRKLAWYAMRWKIETFHTILKSGCKAEAFEAPRRRENRQPDRRVLHPQLAYLLDDDDEPSRANGLAHSRTDDHRCTCWTCSFTTRAPAGGVKLLLRPTSRRLPGWAAISHARRIPPPGNAVMWRGLSRLTDIELGFVMAAQLVGKLKGWKAPVLAFRDGRVHIWRRTIQPAKMSPFARMAIFSFLSVVCSAGTVPTRSR